MGAKSELEVVVKASAAQFQATMKGVEQRAAAVGGSLRNIAGVVAGGFAVGRVVAFTAELAAGAERVTLLADRLNATTAGVQKLGYAAEMAGMDSSKLERGIVTLQKAVVGGAKEFARLGLSAQEVANMKSDQAMMRVADALQVVESASERTAIATKLFGKEGARIAQIANDSAGGLSAMAEEARAIGYAMDDLTLAKFGKMDDGIDRMTASIKGLAQTILADLGPAVEKAANIAAGVAAGAKGLSEAKFTPDLKHIGAFAGHFLKHTFRYGVPDPFSLVSGGIDINKLYEFGAGDLDRKDPWGGFHGKLQRFKSQFDTGKISKETYDEKVQDAQYERDKELGLFDPSKAINAAAQQASEMADRIKEKYGAPDTAMERNKIMGQLELGNIDQATADAALSAINKADPMWQAMDKLMTSIKEGAERRAKDAEAAAEQVYKSVQTPAEKYVAEMARISELQASGALAPEYAARAGAQVQGNYLSEEEAAGRGPAAAAAAAKNMQDAQAQAAKAAADLVSREFGTTRDVRAAVTRSGLAERQIDPSLQRLDKSNQYLDRIASAVEREPVATWG